MSKSAKRSIAPIADLIDDNATLDGIGMGPLRLRFQLSRGDRWTGRLELNQENAVEMALKIISAAWHFGDRHCFNKEQRADLVEIALAHAHRKRHRAITAQYDAGEITLDEANRLGKEVAAQCRAEIDTLAAD
jgi:hypothetical protein